MAIHSSYPREITPYNAPAEAQSVKEGDPPGDILQKTIEAIGMSQAELAQRMGRPTKTINGIIKNKVAITFETALQLERVLGIPAKFWNNREQSYRERLARQEEEKFLASRLAWLAEIPVAAMTAHGWLPSFEDKIQQLRGVLQFFGVASPEQWRQLWSEAPADAFQSSAFQRQRGPATAWLRRGELAAQHIACAPYETKAFRRRLTTLRRLTLESPETWPARLTAACAQAGVAVTFAPPLPGVSIYGATRWLTSTKALIQLSAGHQTDDRLWFIFFHQAGHVILHGKRDVFLESDESGLVQEPAKEAEADAFAADLLIPPRLWGRFLASSDYLTKTALQQFAARLGVAPGLVVGRLQREGRLPEDYYNEFKVTLPVTGSG